MNIQHIPNQILESIICSLISSTLSSAVIKKKLKLTLNIQTFRSSTRNITIRIEKKTIYNEELNRIDLCMRRDDSIKDASTDKVKTNHYETITERK